MLCYEKVGAKYSSRDIFASKLICEDCGSFYGKKKWHSNSKYSRFVYQCNRKFDKGKETCHTPHIMESGMDVIDKSAIVHRDKSITYNLDNGN